MDDNKCPGCNNDLFISNTYISNKKDWLPLVETETYNNIELVCINPKCRNYCGTDLNKPNKVVKTVSNRIN